MNWTVTLLSLLTLISNNIIQSNNRLISVIHEDGTRYECLNFNRGIENPPIPGFIYLVNNQGQWEIRCLVRASNTIEFTYNELNEVQRRLVNQLIQQGR